MFFDVKLCRNAKLRKNFNITKSTHKFFFKKVHFYYLQQKFRGQCSKETGGGMKVES